jgi:hypothetical protein
MVGSRTKVAAHAIQRIIEARQQAQPQSLAALIWTPEQVDEKIHEFTNQYSTNLDHYENSVFAIKNEDELVTFARLAGSAATTRSALAAMMIKEGAIISSAGSSDAQRQIAEKHRSDCEAKKEKMMRLFNEHRKEAKELARRRAAEKSQNFQKLLSQPPKLNTKLSAIVKLTPEYLKKNSFWEWLVTFDLEVGVADERTLVAYLKCSTYVDLAVYKDGLKLLPQPHTFESLVRMLDDHYPDRASSKKRLEKFQQCAQTTNKVATYNYWKEFYWSLVHPEYEAGFDYPLFKDSWIWGLHPKLKKKLKYHLTDLELDGKICTYKLAKIFVQKKEIALIEHDADYKKFFKVASTPAFPVQPSMSSSGTPTSTPAPAPNPIPTTTSTPTSTSTPQPIQPSLPSLPVVQSPSNSSRKTNSDPKGECVQCKGAFKANYDGHYWIDCKKKFCMKCKDYGHMAHRCPTAVCPTCNQKGHTGYSHGILPK